MDASMPFGGFKESGWGRELSEEGLSSYLESKSVWVKLH
jgi:acyl-CoA reductase-like NAD-dependent aldehyde dehydrogenase